MSHESWIQKRLESILEGNEQNNVAPSESRVIRSLLNDGVAVGSFEHEINRNLPDEIHRQWLVNKILGALAYVLPGVDQAEQDRQRIEELTDEIHEAISKLSEKISLRTTLAARSAITTPESHNPLNWVTRAIESTGLRSHIYGPLIEWQSQFIEYPEPSAVLDAINDLEMGYEPEHIERANLAGADGKRSTYMPRLRALWWAQLELVGKGAPQHQPVPVFRLSDRTTAALINAVWQNGDGGVSADTIKKARQRWRKSWEHEQPARRPDGIIDFLS